MRLRKFIVPLGVAVLFVLAWQSMRWPGVLAAGTPMSDQERAERVRVGDGARAELRGQARAALGMDGVHARHRTAGAAVLQLRGTPAPGRP